MDGKVRLCVDYKDLNRARPKDDFPLPHIDILVANIVIMLCSPSLSVLRLQQDLISRRLGENFINHSLGEPFVTKSFHLIKRKQEPRISGQ